MGLMKFSIAILITMALSHVAQFADAAVPPTWTPGTPCTGGCIVEIVDHNGIAPTSSGSFVFRVRRPRTIPGGPAPYLDLYNPTLTKIEKCARMVRSIRKPHPGSVRLRAREYTLSGSDRVVFLVDRCRKLSGHGTPPPPPPPEECASGDEPDDYSCSITSTSSLSVTDTRSGDSCNLYYTDAHHGPDQRVIYDNSYSVTCKDSIHQPSVYLGTTSGDSNWDVVMDSSETCQLLIAERPSDSSWVVQKILCPTP